MISEHLAGLEEMALPDEWYPAKGDTVARRFAAAGKAMRPSVSGAVLMQRYSNGGRPFVHSVWLNQPLPCPRCRDAGADGVFTVLSVDRGCSVELSAGEIHAVRKHGGPFPPEKLAALKQILALQP